MGEDKKYWTNLDEFKIENPMMDAQQNQDSIKPSRRDFLKIFGFGVASSAAILGCKRPVEKAIPFLVKPEEILPGKAVYYASTFFEENEYCSILVKNRDGRPIKIEANPNSPITGQGTSATVQASVLNLYDENRYQHPMVKGKQTSWEALDKQVIAKLKELSANNKKIVLLTPSIISPSLKNIIEDFQQTYPTTKWISYDAISMAAMREANLQTFDQAAIPSYRFDKAQVIVSIDADFLGTWLSPIEFAKQYASTRDLTLGKQTMSRHYQVESGMSLTGTNADVRYPVDPSEYGRVITHLYNGIAAELGHPIIKCGNINIDVTPMVDDLLAKKGESLVVCGINLPEYQVVVNAINQMLGNINKTIDFDRAINYFSADDPEFDELITMLNDGEVGAVITWDVNPVYNHPKGKLFAEYLSKDVLSISLSSTPDETSNPCNIIAPSQNYLESWGDFQPKSGMYSLAQPTIPALFETRAVGESLLSWSGNTTSHRDYIKSYWKEELFNKQSTYSTFDEFWAYTLQKGVFEVQPQQKDISLNQQVVDQALSQISKKVPAQNLILHLYESISLRSGKFASNPWLQECPDPVTRSCWGNFAAISPALAREKELKEGDVISFNNLELPVLIQPGQATNTISIALGYGRELNAPNNLPEGVNAFHLQYTETEYRLNYMDDITYRKVGNNEPLAIVQGHHSMEGRPLVQEENFQKWELEAETEKQIHPEKHLHHVSLYEDHEYQGHHWAMLIDLNACIGCSSCVVACMAENNIPVVGKQEVQRVHEMHWIRIDRYYSGDENNPEVVRQPVMCQHCDSAPCENVCPVAATNHSSEGINQMAYNRCIGTRYCNNNCPYKVRRFNWFDYTGADAIPHNRKDPTGMTTDLRRMVLNPDVTIRSKGVIEKCSFCIQRIQEKKLDAKLEKRVLKDGEVQTACQQSCPANAIVFGDINDPGSRVAKLMKDPRNYHLLEELHTLPSVGYLRKIRNNTI